MATIPGYDRITVERGKLGGKPCIRGMRISVSRVLDILATYKSREEIRVDFPDLEDEDLEQALRFAAENAAAANYTDARHALLPDWNAATVVQKAKDLREGRSPDSTK